MSKYKDKIIAEARQLKDKSKEMMIVKNTKVIVIDKSDWPTYKVKGWMQAESIEIDEGKYTRYSDLLVQLGRMKQAKDKQGEMLTQKEVDKEKKKLGIQEKSAPPIPDNVKHLFDKDKNFKDKLSKFKFIKMVRAGQVKGITPSMVDDLTELTEFTSAQMTKLKKEYEPLKGKRLPVGAIDKMNTMLKKYSTDMLMKLAKGDIPFLSTAAKSELVIKRGKKWSDFKEPLDMAEADELQCEACWKGFKQVGLKKKGDRMVPNCVPEENLQEVFYVFEDPDCPTCIDGECQCSTPEIGKVHECCGGEECICDSLEEARYEVEADVEYRGVRYRDEVLVVVDASSESDADKKAEKMIRDLRQKKKIGPGGGGSVKEIELGIVQRTNKKLGTFSSGMPNENEIEEKLKVKYDKTKQGWFDDKGRRRYLGNAATNALMKKKLDHAIKTGDWTSFDVSKEEIEFNFLEEKFTKKDFKDNERNNEHGLNAKKVVDMFGTSAEKMKIDAINARHNMKGHISREDQRTRDSLVSKYYNKLKEDLDSKDKETIEPIIKQLKKSVKAHDRQAKQLQKDIKDEADLTKKQIKMVHKTADDLPKSDFVKRYGKDGDSVRFATATNMVKKKLGIAENLIKGEINEMTYKDKFNATMKDFGINSLGDLKSDEEKKKFFKAVDAKHDAKNEEKEPYHPGTEGGMGEMMKKEMMKKIEMLKAETDPEKMEMMKKEMMKEMEKMPEMMKKEMMKKMEMAMKEYGSMNAMKKMKKEETDDVAEMAEMKPMNAMKMNAMYDKKKMNAMTMQDPKQDMLKKHSNDDIKAMKKMEMDMATNKDDTETPSMEMMKKMNAMKMKGEMKSKKEMMKAGNPMYAMKDAGKEMMAAMKKINAMKKPMKEKYMTTKPGSLEEVIMKASNAIAGKKTD